ncbi:hypothetical protein OGM63_17405 [Plectonema radiosum NIES-515]|uniref:Uncharacterized protein n=1 Tax=Plectonema radiosum NIES-515 TaxID=2986073 RepID=A0ABT3B1L2_9CYAN|nr:hypothetical protein [Plectonema radiosum]MCV3215266.1 hypothetical protein [Plectonema radiosum NIES-515]
MQGSQWSLVPVVGVALNIGHLDKSAAKEAIAFSKFRRFQILPLPQKCHNF